MSKKRKCEGESDIENIFDKKASEINRSDDNNVKNFNTNKLE